MITVALLAPIVSADATTRVCYADATGCHTNLLVSNALMPTLNAVLVCADHVLLGTADSTQCPANTPGVYYSCTPAGGGYCNATLVTFGSGLYQWDVTATGSAAAALTMGGFGTQNYSASVDGAPVGNPFIGSGLASVNVPNGGGTHRVKYELVASGTLGGSTSGGGAAAGGGPANVAPIVVNVEPPGSAAVQAATQAGAQWGWAVAMGLGVLLILLGEPQVSPGFQARFNLRPRHWLAGVGAFFLLAGIITASVAHFS